MIKIKTKLTIFGILLIMFNLGIYNASGLKPLLYSDKMDFEYSAGKITQVNIVVLDDDPKKWWVTVNNQYAGGGNLKSGNIAFQLSTIAGNYTYIFFVEDFSNNIANLTFTVFVSQFTATTSADTTILTSTTTQTTNYANKEGASYSLTLTLFLISIGIFTIIKRKRRNL